VTTTLDQLVELLARKEDEHLELKEAKNHFDFEKLVKYCAALANEGGGRIILGVTDKRPRRVVGTQAFQNLERTKAGLVDKLRLRIDADVIDHPDGRVIVFDVPPRPVGFPIQYKGAYWMRGGEDLVPMTQDMLQRIFAESQPDFSAELCRAATLSDLDTRAIARFRAKWIEKSRRADLRRMPADRLLEDAELTVDGAITFAALILLGTRRALGRHLGQAEVVFEYRSDDAAIGYQQRKEYREGFLLFEESLWETINLRNDLFSLQDGLFRREIPAFNESAVREAILNAVSHRDYRLAGSTFVKQFNQRLQIDSPGGFPAGVSPENILERQSPRNRRLADALARCGLVERSGQGADRMFSAAVSEGKLPPDFSRSDEYLVSVTLHGQVQDEDFLRFLERLGGETQRGLSLDDLIVLDAVHREARLPERVRARIPHLVALGAVERVSKTKLVLSKRFYVSRGRPGEYTRRKGLDRETRKALLVKHIESAGDQGAPLEELSQVLPEASRNELKVLLRELKQEGLAHTRGVKRGARWHIGATEAG
jgi:ATP-dependent DNA helicase RecG